MPKFNEDLIRKALEYGKTNTVAKVCEKYGCSEATYYVWKSRYGQTAGKVSASSELSLEAENRALRAALGDALVEVAMLKQRGRD